MLEVRDWVGLDCLVEIGAVHLSLGNHEEAANAAREASGLAFRLIGHADLENQLRRLANLLVELQCDAEALEIAGLIRSPRARQNIAERVKTK